MFNFWILSINDRNLNYIKKLNPKTSMNLADNKIETKNFLEKRSIPVPKTIAFIKNKKDLLHFDFSIIKQKSFVIKPVYWSKWRWILIVEKIDNENFSILWTLHKKDFLINHMLDILNWDYSLNYWYDNVLIEEKLISWNWFEIFCDHWLADIRIIVYNMIVVAAMVRMPTKSSHWKANLAQGWIWIWIEVWSGTTNTFYQNWKVYENNFPLEYTKMEDFQLPFWDYILLNSSKTQFFVNMGYLAIDWVITKEWPKILEINARAWLEIQNVCLLPLKKRLDKVKDFKITDPEKWVELSKSLFSKNTLKNTWKLIYLSQKANLVFEQESKEIILRVSTIDKETKVWKEIFNIINKFDYKIIYKNEKQEIIKNISKILDESIDDYEIVLWLNDLKDFIIKPENTIENKIYKIFKSINKNELDILIELDKKISKLDKKINFSSLRPTNYTQELEKFISLNWKYSPIFEYNFPKIEKLEQANLEITWIINNYFKKWFELKSKFSKIFFDKLQELQNKILLLEAYTKQDFDNILKYNKILFWDINQELVEFSKQKSFIIQEKSSLWKQVTATFFASYVKDYLSKNNFKNVFVSLNSSSFSRVSVSKEKQYFYIKISSQSIFYEKELDWIIAHEIWIHLNRAINWSQTSWEILKNWTANYLTTEEWLAVYNSLKYYPTDLEKNAMYQKYYLCYISWKNSFSDLVDLWFTFKWNNLIWIFKMISRFKRWIINTSIKNHWAIFMKDKIYLDWYSKIQDYIKNNQDLNKLMIWKIKISDLEFIY